MNLEQVTVLIITFNEEANIQRTLEGLKWAQDILVIDSCSTDRTLEILSARAGCRVLQREFKNFADQCNFGLSQIETRWVLSIDADYVFPEGSGAAIQNAISRSDAAFQIEFDYCINGVAVKGSILPPRTVLYRKEGAAYESDGHGHRVNVQSGVEQLPFRVRHDDRKDLSRWLLSQVTYARQEAEKLRTTDLAELGLNDRIRKKIVFAPVLVFLLVYIFRGGLRSGWRGLFYALQRFTAELLLSLFLIDDGLQSLVKPKQEDKAS